MVEKEQDEYFSYKKMVVFGAECSGKSTLREIISGSSRTFNAKYEKTEKKIQSTKVVSEFMKEKRIQMTLNVFEVRLEEKMPSVEELEILLFECQCALLIVDANSKDSFHKVEELLKIIQFSQRIQAYDYLTVILLENKVDIGKEVSNDDISQLLQSNKIANKEIMHHSISLKETSFKQEPLTHLLEMIHAAENNPKNRVSLNVVSISSKKTVPASSIKIVLLGDSGVGKTALLTRHFKNDFNETFMSTIGIGDETENVKVKDEIYKLQVWDTAGQFRFRTLPKQYYQNADGILMLFSFDLRDSFNNVSKWMAEIENNSNKNILVYLLGNKCDIDEKEKTVSRKEAEEAAKINKIDYYEISCKNNINIDEVICKMVLSCYAKATGCSDVFSLGPKKQVKKGGCCGGEKK